MKALELIIKCFLVFTLLSSCSGGGDGGSGRTRDTAIRVIHGSIDLTPVTVQAKGENGQVSSLMTVRYGQANPYVRVLPGVQTVVLSRANMPEVLVSSLNIDFKKNTEYSILLFGEAQSGNLISSVIEDTVERPEKGLARVRLVNAINDQPSVMLTGLGLDVPPVSFGNAGPFIDVPVGIYEARVQARKGQTLAQTTLNLLDRAEVTVLAGGSSQLNFFFATVFDDLD